MQRLKFWIGASLLVVLGVIIGHLGANYDAYWPGNKAYGNEDSKTTSGSDSAKENGATKNRLGSTASPAGGVVKSPTGIAPDRYVYYPGTEELKKDEIRIICCGSGMPAARHGQAACCWLMECGNGDKFLFDLGTGSMANVAALMIPYQYLDKVFLSHLHTDHFGTSMRYGLAVGQLVALTH